MKKLLILIIICLISACNKPTENIEQKVIEEIPTVENSDSEKKEIDEKKIGKDLNTAIQNSDWEKVDEILNKLDENNTISAEEVPNDLITAIEKGDIEQLKLKIEKIANLDDYIYIKKAYNDCIAQWEELSVTLLGKAVQKNDIQIVKLLLDKGANVNKGTFYKVVDSEILSSETPLFIAISNNNKEIAELLISKGADVNFVYEEISGDCEDESSSVLMEAIKQENKDLVNLLINNGANANQIIWQGDSQTTAQEFAQEKGNQEIINLLK